MVQTQTQQAIDHAHQNQAVYLEGFKELLKIPSVSTDPKHKGDIEHCADWIIAEMERIGFKECRKIPTDGHPVVYGEWLEAGDDKPTALVYAHYDVQPIDPLNLWESAPFEPTERDSKLYARGTIDDKAGVWVNLKAFESIFQTEGKLPLNVKIFFEGEEEMGSPNMQPFVDAHTDLLKADYLVLSDNEFSAELPTLAVSARGIVAAEVKIIGPDHDLHSGSYGGAVHNPIHMVGKIISSFHDDDGRIQIKGFYDRVKKLTINEQEAMDEAWMITGEKHKEGAGIDKFWAENLAPMPDRLTALPTLDVNGIWGGYQGDGVKTVIPSEAGFKTTMRIVADMDPKEIAQSFKEHVMSFAVDTLEINVNILVTAFAFTLDIEGHLLESVQKSLETVVGKRAVLVRGGGSVPIGGMFQNALGIPITAYGFGAGEGAHAPNEYINLDEFYIGIDAAIHFYHFLAETP